MQTHKFDSDITKVTSGIIVHGCNAQGVMGSGVAKQLRATFPEIFEDYLHHLEMCRVGNIPALGEVAKTKINDKLWIASAITQEYYGRDGKKYVSYDALELAFEKVFTLARKKNLVVQIPYLIGAGLGGGNANIIQRIIEENTQDLEVVYHHWK